MGAAKSRKENLCSDREDRRKKCSKQRKRQWWILDTPVRTRGTGLGQEAASSSRAKVGHRHSASVSILRQGFVEAVKVPKENIVAAEKNEEGKAQNKEREGEEEGSLCWWLIY